MTTLVNPNAPLGEAQIAQIREKMGDFEVVAASVNFPSAANGGLGKAAYGSAMGYPTEFVWAPTGQSTGAAAVLATLHGRQDSKFGRIVVFGGPKEGFPFVGTADLDTVRNAARETRYEETESTPVGGEVLILNFSHPITDAQKGEIAKLVGVELTGIEFREGLSRQYAYATADQLVAAVREQVNAAKVSASDWQSTRVFVNLPALSAGAMIALAEMHGRMGYFPSALRIEKVGDAFSFTEVIDLDALRLKSLAVAKSGQKMVTLPQDLLVRLMDAFDRVAFDAAPQGYDEQITNEVRSYLR